MCEYQNKNHICWNLIREQRRKTAFVLFFSFRVFRKRTAVLGLKSGEKALKTHRYACFMQKLNFRQSGNYLLFCETYMFWVAKDKVLHAKRRSFAPRKLIFCNPKGMCFAESRVDFVWRIIRSAWKSTCCDKCDFCPIFGRKGGVDVKTTEKQHFRLFCFSVVEWFCRSSGWGRPGVFRKYRRVGAYPHPLPKGGGSVVPCSSAAKK